MDLINLLFQAEDYEVLVQVFEAQNFNRDARKDTTTIVVYIDGKHIWTVQDSDPNRPRLENAAGPSDIG